jgi:hypothetical protein
VDLLRGFSQLVLDVVLWVVVDECHVVVGGGSLGIEHFITLAGQRGPTVVNVLVLVLMRVMQGQIWVLIDAALHGHVVAMLGKVMVGASALATLGGSSGRVDRSCLLGVDRVLGSAHPEGCRRSCRSSRYLDSRVDRRKERATRRTGTKATKVINQGDMVESGWLFYYVLRCFPFGTVRQRGKVIVVGARDLVVLVRLASQMDGSSDELGA